MTGCDCDYLVVGSGFGGAVSALRLLEKRYRVIVLCGYTRGPTMICARRATISQRAIFDIALHRSVIARWGNRATFMAARAHPPRSRRHLRLARDCELDGPAASAPVPLAWSQPRVGWRSCSSDVVNVSGRFVLARVAAVLKSSAANSRQRATRLIHLNAKGMLS